MVRRFALGAVIFVLGTAIAGCSNTAEGAKQDAVTDTSAVKEAGDKAAVATEKATDRAVNATEQAAHNAAVATKDVADKTAVATEQAAATTGAAVSKAGKNTSDALTLTPKVKLALVNDSELNNTKNTINVESGNNQVRLEGHVMTNEMKKRASSIAEKTVTAAGTSDSVKNDLEVSGQ